MGSPAPSRRQKRKNRQRRKLMEVKLLCPGPRLLCASRLGGPQMKLRFFTLYSTKTSTEDNNGIYSSQTRAKFHTGVGRGLRSPSCLWTAPRASGMARAQQTAASASSATWKLHSCELSVAFASRRGDAHVPIQMPRAKGRCCGRGDLQTEALSGAMVTQRHTAWLELPGSTKGAVLHTCRPGATFYFDSYLMAIYV